MLDFCLLVEIAALEVFWVTAWNVFCQLRLRFLDYLHIRCWKVLLGQITDRIFIRDKHWCWLDGVNAIFVTIILLQVILFLIFIKVRPFNCGSVTHRMSETILIFSFALIPKIGHIHPVICQSGTLECLDVAKTRWRWILLVYTFHYQLWLSFLHKQFLRFSLFYRISTIHDYMFFIFSSRIGVWCKQRLIGYAQIGFRTKMLDCSLLFSQIIFLYISAFICLW